MTCTECGGTPKSCMRGRIKCCPDCTHGALVVFDPDDDALVERIVHEAFRVDIAGLHAVGRWTWGGIVRAVLRALVEDGKP